MKFKHSIQAGIVALCATIAGVSCTDTWDEHYSVNSSSVAGVSLWDLIGQDESLTNFKRVLDSCDFDRILGSNQVFSVWAPEIDEVTAQQWIDAYKAEKARGVREEDNTALNQFIKNHIALYNHQVSAVTKEDTIVMMNGKRMTLTADMINNDATIDGKPLNAGNGVLYKVNKTLTFTPNIWERIQVDAEGENALDSAYKYIASWNEIVLNESASVQGGIKDGKVWYLDSVMTTYNQFLSRYGTIQNEDSLYWYLVPTNKVWNEKLDEFKSYFQYHSDRGKKMADSLQNDYAKKLLTSATFFNVRDQYENFNIDNPDSICNTNYSSYNPKYNVFDKPFENGGILSGLDFTECSNGRLYKMNEWNVPLLRTNYVSDIEIQAEYSDVYSTVPLIAASKDDSTMVIGNVIWQDIDSLTVGGGRFLRVSDTRTPARKNQPEVSFNISNTLSNIPYDIYVVFATPLARDTTAASKAEAQLKRQVTAKIRYYISSTQDMHEPANALTIGTKIDIDATKMDTVKINTASKYANGVTFPVCNYGESDPRVVLTLQSLKGNDGNLKKGYAQELYIDEIILVPLIEENKQ